MKRGLGRAWRPRPGAEQAAPRCPTYTDGHVVTPPPQMQAGDQCFYGTDLGNAIAQGPSTACTSGCTASAATNCGGTDAVSVYTVG